MAARRGRGSRSIDDRFGARAVKCPLASAPVRSLTDYFNVLGTFVRPPGGYWFRGHARLDWTLLPTALRYSRLAERQAALELVPQFKRVASIRLPRPPDQGDKLEWLQVAQHYGLPTRLLDWTENPMVALYFACFEHQDEDGLVLLLNPADLNRLSAGVARVLDAERDGVAIEKRLASSARLTMKGLRPVAIYPVHNSERLMLQKGVFTLHGNHVQGLRHDTPSLAAVPIPREAKVDLVGDLTGVGVDEMSIFPEVEHVARQLKRRAGLA